MAYTRTSDSPETVTPSCTVCQALRINMIPSCPSKCEKEDIHRCLEETTHIPMSLILNWPWLERRVCDNTAARLFPSSNSRRILLFFLFLAPKETPDVQIQASTLFHLPLASSRSVRLSLFLRWVITIAGEPMANGQRYMCHFHVSLKGASPWLYVKDTGEFLFSAWGQTFGHVKVFILKNCTWLCYLPDHLCVPQPKQHFPVHPLVRWDLGNNQFI